ncbi:MAG: putative Na+/H+ antiporter [Methylophilales bacterium]|nr:putative Na+/H+ antiporter [Methylophilales bacterium]
MLDTSFVNMIGAILFLVAIIHTFSTKKFEHLARINPRYSGILHLLGEVEIVFGFWAMILILFMFGIEGKESAVGYVESRNFTEPMFVFVIMVIAATKPILQLSRSIVLLFANWMPINKEMAIYFLLLTLVPLMGSFITEPAAMTLAAMLLGQNYFGKNMSNKFKYATLGVLFVNISIGGTLTPYAAPPVLMVSATWDWDIWFMITNFGWRSAIAVFVNAILVVLIFKDSFKKITIKEDQDTLVIPLPVILMHLFFLVNVVIFAHHPAIFMGLFLFFLGYTTAYKHYQNPLILNEALLVAFFLAGLVVLGGVQQWWLEPTLMSMNSNTVYFGATILTAFTDNAALTYLGSLVEGLSDEFKIALVAGAVTGGGLTVIANAPNPAGISILREHFSENTINPVGLFLGALLPTCISVIAFRVL